MVVSSKASSKQFVKIWVLIFGIHCQDIRGKMARLKDFGILRQNFYVDQEFHLIGQTMQYDLKDGITVNQ